MFTACFKFWMIREGARVSLKNDELVNSAPQTIGQPREVHLPLHLSVYSLSIRTVTQRGYRAVTFREGHFRGGILEVSKERGSGRTPGFYRAVRSAEAFFRQAAGGLPTLRLKARLKAYSDS